MIEAKQQAISASSSSFKDWILDSQRQFRQAERELLSRPVELPSELARTLDETVKRVFSEYVDQDYQPPLITWSGLFDQPSSEKAYWFDIRNPENIAESDQSSYEIGIQLINEWATNYLTKKLINEGFCEHPALALLSKFFRILIDSTGLSYRKVSRLMSELKETAESDSSFDHAVCTAYFCHQFDQLNQLLQHSDTAQDLSDIAVLVGSDSCWSSESGLTRKVMEFIDYDETDGETKRLIKRIVSSLIGVGRNANPGVIELSITSPVLLTFIPINTRYAVVFALLNAGIVGSVLVHETVHAYSKDQNFSGVIPVEFIKNKPTS
mgnify:CR=1 FL=1